MITKLNRVCGTQSAGQNISLSAWVIIVLIAARGTNWYSIGRSACAIHGQRSKNAEASEHNQTCWVVFNSSLIKVTKERGVEGCKPGLAAKSLDCDALRL